MSSILKLMPHEYVHVENTNTCDVITLVGPITFTLYDHHKQLHHNPEKLIVVPPCHYVEVKNPQHHVPAGSEAAAAPLSLLLRSNATTLTGVETLCYSRWQSPYGSSELRFAEDAPFALLPGEEASMPVEMPLLAANEALVLEASAAHATTDPRTGAERQRAAQELFLFCGPGRYRPRLDETVVRKVEGVYVSSAKHVCYLTALHDFVDETNGAARVAGERWSLRTDGILFPHPAVELQVQDLCIVTVTEAAEFESTEAFYDDDLQVQRVARQPYLITRADTANGVYAPRCCERLVQRRPQIHLSATQYCVMANPVGPDGLPRLREAVVLVGKRSVVPQPGERVTRVLDALVLREDEALLLTALQTFTEAPDGSSSSDAAAPVVREGGARWLVHGPRQYIPPIYARVVERRHVITLDENSGVYVRNTVTGVVRSVFGAPFMLSAEEELWERPISAYVRRLLSQPRQSLRVDDMSADEIAEAAVEEGRANVRFSDAAQGPSDRYSSSSDDSTIYTEEELEEEGAEESDASAADKRSGASQEGADAAPPAAAANPYAATRDVLRIAERNARPARQSADITPFHVISANVEQNTVMRLYDTSTGRSRVVAGPATVYLEPHEQFTPLSLSGGRPKEPHQIHSLSLYLGPDYMADIIEVETRDHARLKLHLAYNWEFDGLEPGSETGVDAQLAFTIPDFIGQACKALASRVRSVIAGQTFEYFHCNSTTLIRQAIFASAADGSTVIKDDALFFTANGLRITTVDVQSVEPVDTKTRVALTKSVQLAVEIITRAQESDASHQAALLEQEARGALELQVMRDRAKSEAQRTALLLVMGDNTVLEQAGASRAQALAESEARLTEAQGEVDATSLRCAAHSVGMETELDVLRQRAELDLAHRAAMNALAAAKLRRIADIEASKVEKIMSALGQETLVALANAGPELKAELLGALGLQGFVVTDGSTPINMLNFADQIASTSRAA